MIIGLGADQNAYGLKKELIAYIEELGFQVKDYGCFSEAEIDYPDIAFTVCSGILSKEIDRGILLCGTGIGMAISANKIPGIRAAQVPDTYSAERAQLSNDAQIITIGSKVMGVEVAKKVVKEYLSNTFVGGNSAKKIKKIMDKEKEYKK